ncbi:hypothetical protein DPMN_144283 [Dreissena polymorpha]|uniref:Uncharacterized protein n=1 Tax=Dreissena polymorpha TaxID=45954 RepID=A0A9D4JQ25_DREPO|nr:hypothetical protein DPMN_144283 [Dreissena polymorpha]
MSDKSDKSSSKGFKHSKYQPAGNMEARGEDRPKHTNSEVSNDSAYEGSIKQQLESMEKSLVYITNEMKSILKREEIETLITNTITSIITEVERRNEEHIKQMKNDLAK